MLVLAATKLFGNYYMEKICSRARLLFNKFSELVFSLCKHVFMFA